MTFAERRFTKFHIELTERCNAACPMCGRNQHGGKINPNLRDREISLEAFQQFFPEPLLEQISQLRLCGNFGDPAAARDCLEILAYARAANPRLTLRMNTNGGLRPPDWWRKLARFFREAPSTVQFGIDGLEDTNHLYRRNVRWESLMENTEAFLRAGGNAHWVFLVFEHNEHQLDAVREQARARGFSQFTVKASKRFLSARSLEVRWEHAVESGKGDRLYSIRPPRSTALRNSAVLEAERRNAAVPDARSVSAILDSTPITCRSLNNSELFVSAQGLLFPCCWTAASIFPADRAGPTAEIWEKITASGGAEQIDLNRNSIAAAVESPFFAELTRSWSCKSIAAGKPQVCARVCGDALHPFEAQFEHFPLRPATPDFAALRAFHF